MANSEAVTAEHSRHYNAVLGHRDDVTDGLAVFRVRVDGDPFVFLPGQYLTLGLELGGRLVQRPYSIASSARRLGEGYELYIREVAGGALTPDLFRTLPGQRLSLRGPKGRFVIEPGDTRRHVFIATGCGIAPFVSILRTLADDGTPRPVVVLHGVSYARELGYRRLFEAWGRAGPLSYVPTISRPAAPENAAWDGRVGRVERILDGVCDDLEIRPADTIAYVCGNPEMITAVQERLRARGFGAAQIRSELYWPRRRLHADTSSDQSDHDA